MFNEGNLYVLLNDKYFPAKDHCTSWLLFHFKCDGRYFELSDFYIPNGKQITTVFCTFPFGNASSTNVSQGMDIVGFFSDQLAERPQRCPPDSTVMTLFNFPGYADSLKLCVTSASPDSTINPNRIPFGGVSSCQTGNPYLKNQPKDCAPGFSRFSFEFYGLCQVLVCFDEKHANIQNSKVVSPVYLPPFHVKGTSAVFIQSPVSVNFEKATSREVKTLFARRINISAEAMNEFVSLNHTSTPTNHQMHLVGYGVMVSVAMVGVWAMFMKHSATESHIV